MMPVRMRCSINGVDQSAVGMYVDAWAHAGGVWAEPMTSAMIAGRTNKLTSVRNRCVWINTADRVSMSIYKDNLDKCV